MLMYLMCQCMCDMRYKLPDHYIRYDVFSLCHASVVCITSHAAYC